MDKIKYRCLAFILLTLMLGSINSGIVRAAESSSYRLETYQETADALVGASDGYSVHGSLDWSRRVLAGEHYQIVPDGGSGYSSSSATDTGTSPGREGGEMQSATGGGHRAGFPSILFGSDRVESSEIPMVDGMHQASVRVPVVQQIVPDQPTPQDTVRTSPKKKIAKFIPIHRPFVRSTIVEIYTPITSIPCISHDTRIGCMTIAEATFLSRLSFLYRAKEAISSIPAFQTMGRSVFTSSLMTMRSGSISVEGLFFPFAFLRRRRKNSKTQRK